MCLLNVEHGPFVEKCCPVSVIYFICVSALFPADILCNYFSSLHCPHLFWWQTFIFFESSAPLRMENRFFFSVFPKFPPTVFSYFQLIYLSDWKVFCTKTNNIFFTHTYNYLPLPLLLKNVFRAVQILFFSSFEKYSLELSIAIHKCKNSISSIKCITFRWTPSVHRFTTV